MPQSPRQTLEDEEPQPQAVELEIKHPRALDEPQREEEVEEAAIEKRQTLDEEDVEANREENEESKESDDEIKPEEEENELGEEIEREEEKLEEEQPDVTVPEIQALNPNPRRRKKRPLTALARQRLGLLGENFNPIPFSPSKALDFAVHEELFRALNMWEFAHLDLSSELLPDLLILLIANYDASKHRSFVHDVEISVGRLELARALKLPLEQKDGETHRDIFSKDESKEVIEEFLSNYILLEDEDEDDMCILLEEVVAATQLVKEGKANRVDWAGLMWALVEKEFMQVPISGSCHYASHLQCLVKCQQPGLFDEKEAGPEAVRVPEPESSMEVSNSMDEEDEDYDDDDADADADAEVGFEMKMRRLEEFRDMGYGRQELGLSSDISENEGLMIGIEHCKGSEEGDWVNEGKDQTFEHCLRRCNSNDVRGMGFENLCKGEQVEREEEFTNLERLTSTGLLHAMDAVQVSYSPRMSLDQNTGDFVSMGVEVEDEHKNGLVDPAPGGSVFFENNGKRHIDNVDIEDDDDDVGQFHQSNQQKRIRCGGLWEEQVPSGFDSYMEQIQYSMRKAKMLYAEKEQACVDAHLQLQYLNEMLEQKDQIIKTLEKTRAEEHLKWQHNLCRYEQELNILAKLVVGYKKALKETQSKFEEYRKECPQGDKPLYRDVLGAGGLVLCSKEVERLQLEKEDEMCGIAEEMLNAFQCDWFIKFQEYHEEVMRLFTRLEDLDGEVKLIKETFAECKSKDT